MHPTLKAAPARVSAITPEAELVSRAASGDGAAFEVLMRRHNQLLFRTARSILSSYDEAEDAVQEAYLRAWRALSSYRAESRLSTWLVRIVTNKALGRLRRTGAQVIPLEAAMTTPEPRDQDVLTDAPDRGPEQSLLRAQIRKMVEARIDLLPEAYRTVFMLRGRGDERRGSRSGAGHSRAHGAQPLLPRPQSLATWIPPSAKSSPSMGRAATASSQMCSRGPRPKERSKCVNTARSCATSRRARDGRYGLTPTIAEWLEHWGRDAPPRGGLIGRRYLQQHILFARFSAKYE
jgi:RNA polymerase sigma factor (sigma-70 family)